jgi:hypothetical protein
MRRLGTVKWDAGHNSLFKLWNVKLVAAEKASEIALLVPASIATAISLGAAVTSVSTVAGTVGAGTLAGSTAVAS